MTPMKRFGILLTLALLLSLTQRAEAQYGESFTEYVPETGEVLGSTRTVLGYNAAFYYDAGVNASWSANGVVSSQSAVNYFGDAEADFAAWGEGGGSYQVTGFHYADAYWSYWELEIQQYVYWDPYCYLQVYWYWFWYYFDFGDGTGDWFFFLIPYLEWEGCWQTIDYGVWVQYWVSQRYNLPPTSSYIYLPPVSASSNTPLGDYRGANSGTLSINGSFLGAGSDPTASVSGSGLSLSNLGLNDGQITASYSIPSTAPGGNYSVRVTTRLGTASVNFTIWDPTPVLSSLAASATSPGSGIANVTMTGSGFGSHPAIQVTPPGLGLILTSASDNQVVASLNLSVAQAGSYTVSVISTGFGSSFFPGPASTARSNGTSFVLNSRASMKTGSPGPGGAQIEITPCGNSKVTGVTSLAVTPTALTSVNTTTMDACIANYYCAQAYATLTSAADSGSVCGAAASTTQTASTVVNRPYSARTQHSLRTRVYRAWCYDYFGVPIDCVPDYWVDALGFSQLSAGDNNGPGPRVQSDFQSNGPIIITGVSVYSYPPSFLLGSTTINTNTNLPVISGLQLSSSPLRGSEGDAVVSGTDLTNLWGPTSVTIEGTGVSNSITYPNPADGGATHQSPSQVNTHYTVDPSASTGNRNLTVSNSFGSSNSVNFTVYDPTPYIQAVTDLAGNPITSIPASTQTYATLWGTGFGSSGTIAICSFGANPCNGSDVSAQSSYWSQNQINVVLTTSATSQGTYEIQLTSLGFSGNGFLSGPSGSSNSTSNRRQFDVGGTQLALTRPTLTQVQVSAIPAGGQLSETVEIISGDNSFSLGSTTITTSGNIQTWLFNLLNPPNPSATGVPAPGALARLTVTYRPPSGASVSKQMNVATFGMSCYYTALESDWGVPPNQCGQTTIGGVTWSGPASAPPGLPPGTYCDAFLATLRLQGSAYLNTGQGAQYYSGNYQTVSQILAADQTPPVANQTVARDRDFQRIIPQRGVLLELDTIGRGLLANDTGSAQRINGYRLDLFRGLGKTVCNSYPNPIVIGACTPGLTTCPTYP